MGESDDSLFEVVVDLSAEFVFDFCLKVIGVGDTEVVIDESLFIEEMGVEVDEFE